MDLRRDVNTVNAHRLIARLTAACLAMLMLCSGAASADSITVNADRLNLRREADTSSKSVGIVEEGDALSFIAEDGDWYQVKSGSKMGFVMKKYVSLNETALAADVAANTELFASPLSGRTTTRINMRQLPLTSSSVVKVIASGKAVEVTGRCGAWYQVKFSGKTGYVMAQYLTVEETGAVSPAPALPVVPAPETPSQSDEDTLYPVSLSGITTERINLRSHPTTSASVLKVLPLRQALTVLGENGSWYKVSCKGKTGYVSKEYVTIQEDSSSEGSTSSGSLISYPAARSGKLTDRVNLRAAASTSSSILRVLTKKAEVSVLGEQNGFYQIKYGGLTGFVSKLYVSLNENASSEDRPADQDTIYSVAQEAMTTTKVNMRRAPEGDVLQLLASETPLLLIGERGAWYLASLNGVTGYISKQYVTAVISAPSAPTQPNGTPSVKPEVSQPDTSGKGTPAYITGNVNMRTGPGTSHGIIKVLYASEEIAYYALQDGWYLIKSDGMTGYVSAKYVTTTKPANPAPSNPGLENVSGKVQQADWWTSNIQQVFARGVVATVTDVETGLSWQVKRSGGSNHADVQPLTAADTAKMKKAYGGAWSWNRRAIWVTINGVSYAASMNGMPHGTGSITTNNFDGHHCIHFLNSRTHTGNRWDSAHQSMVQKAYKAGQ